MPLAAQLSSQVRSLVQSGALVAGHRLPSTRALADELGVARGVVEQGFDQLVAEGWLEGRRGSGTFVSSGVRLTDRRTCPAADRNSSPQGGTSSRPQITLDTGTPWVGDAADSAWRRAWRTVGTLRPPAGYPDPAGLLGLREALVEYVGRHRGIACTPDQVLVTNGTVHGLALLLDILAPGPVAVEDPGYRAAAATISTSGRRVVDIPVDADGIDVASLRRAGDLRAAYVTPAHQHPLGVVMSAARRIELLDEARRADVLLVEDDYDSEFRYDVAPLPALAQLDAERVVYLGTTSKSLTPALRIGWLITTAERAALIATRRAARHDHPSWPMERALLSLFEDGYVDRRVRSARRVYAERSRYVRSRLEPFGATDKGVAGMYLTVATPPGVAESVVETAAEAGVVVQSIASYCRSTHRDGLVVGFGGVRDSDLAYAVDVLVSALAEAGGHAGPLA